MQKTALTALIVLLALAAPLAARDAVTDAMCAPVDAAVVNIGSDRDPGDLCEACNNSYYWTVAEWLTGNETYASYCDPTGCPACEAGWKPVSVTIYLHWAEPNDCELTLSADILAADLSDPESPMPGGLVSTSSPLVVGPLGSGLWAVTVPIPLDCPVMEEPFFAAITFEDDCATLPSLVTDEGPGQSCISWNDWGTGWEDLADYGFPGNVSMYTTLECQGPSPVEQVSWGRIKSLYR